MTLILADRAKETSLTTGTGTLNLEGPETGFQTFVQGVGTTNTTYYAITDGTDWEVGLGTVTSGSPDTLSRDTILASSNSGSAVNFGSGEKIVFSVVPAGKSVFLDSLGDLVISGGLTCAALTSNGIDDNATSTAIRVTDTVLTVGQASNNLTVARNVQDYGLFLAGGNASNDGGNILMYGSTHTTTGDIVFRVGTTVYGTLDASAGSWQMGSIAVPSGNLMTGKSTVDASTAGFEARQGGGIYNIVDGGVCQFVDRLTSDGVLVSYRQDGITEGTVSVSGTTVNYNNFAGGHLSQLSGNAEIPPIPQGTILETVDEMCVWPGEENEQLARVKVSDTPGSKAVYGVFMYVDDEVPDGEEGNPSYAQNDLMVTALGAYKVRIGGGVTVVVGDLIESAGNGCGRVQADDIFRSSTVAKITATTPVDIYPDGSYTVPCTIHCG